MSKQAIKVTIDTREVGQAFGCRGVILSARSGRVIGETGVRPYGMDSVARSDAETLALGRGYVISAEES